MNIRQIATKRDEIESRVTEPGYKTTLRDVAESQELVNQYIDELERLEKIAIPAPVTDISPISETIIRRWYP